MAFETTKLYERDIYKSLTKDIMSNKYSCVYITGKYSSGKSLRVLFDVRVD